jgi:hypothetical protein
MGEQFRLNEEPTELRPQMEMKFGCLDEFSGADDLYRVLNCRRLARRPPALAGGER